jgi:hypothetical protein
MATDIQFSVASRNAQLDAIEAEAGTAAVLNGYSGTRPANVAAARTGVLLFSMTLPSDWMAAASGGSKALSGVWQDLLANATGTAGYWTLFKSDGTTGCLQGDCSMPGAGGSLELINTSLAINQPVSVSAFTITAGGA